MSTIIENVHECQACGALHEEYRPADWSAVVGQDKAIKRILTLGRARGFGGRAWWIAGASGTGKTTLARLLAAELADDWSTEEIDAEQLTPARIVELERQSATRAIGKGGRAYIVNEAHGLRSAAVRQLLVTIEARIPSHVVWIFTTTIDGQDKFGDGDDAGPFLSRCMRVELARRDLADCFAARALSIAQETGLDGGAPIERVKRLVQAERNNLRAVLSRIEAGALLD